LANKVDVKTVQTRLGHASPAITLAWYAHAIPGNDHEAAQMLGSLFAGDKVETQTQKAAGEGPQTTTASAAESGKEPPAQAGKPQALAGEHPAQTADVEESPQTEAAEEAGAA